MRYRIIMNDKYDFSDVKVCPKPSHMGFNVLAKQLDIGRSKLYQFLREQKVLNQDNHPTWAYANVGYFLLKESPYGPLVLLLTPAGVNFVTALVKEKYVDKPYRKKKPVIRRTGDRL